MSLRVVQIIVPEMRMVVEKPLPVRIPPQTIQNHTLLDQLGIQVLPDRIRMVLSGSANENLAKLKYVEQFIERLQKVVVSGK